MLKPASDVAMGFTYWDFSRKQKEAHLVYTLKGLHLIKSEC